MDVRITGISTPVGGVGVYKSWKNIIFAGI